MGTGALFLKLPTALNFTEEQARMQQKKDEAKAKKSKFIKL